MLPILDYAGEPHSSVHRWSPLASVLFAASPWLAFYSPLPVDLGEVTGLVLLWLPFACNVVIWWRIRRSTVNVVQRRIVLLSFVWSLLTVLLTLAGRVRVPSAWIPDVLTS